MKKIFLLLILVFALGGCYKTEFGTYEQPETPETPDTSDDPDDPDTSDDPDDPDTSDDPDDPDTSDDPEEQTQGTLDLVVVNPTGATTAGQEYTIYVDGVEYVISDGSLELTQLVDPGDYTLHIYNTPDEYEFITDTTTDAVIATLPIAADGTVDSNPTEIYYGAQSVTITADSISAVTVEPTAVTRELKLDIDLLGESADLIESMTITLGGVASGWDCTNNVPYGDAASVTITPEGITTASSSKTTTTYGSAAMATKSESYFTEGTISEALNLLGVITTESQTLTIYITYTDGNPTASTFTSDLSSELSLFNDDKSTSFIISTSITLPSESDISGSIGDWETTEDEVIVK